MLTGIVIFVTVIAMIAAADNGEWGSVAVGAVIILLLIGLAKAFTDTGRAYGNFVDYWAHNDRDRRDRK